MANIRKWVSDHKPSNRRLIQLYSALLYNAHLKGYITGDIYVGKIKALCVPGLNCYSCPGAIGACPLGALQNAIASSGHRAPFYVFGIILLFGITFGRTICGYLCPMGLLQELIYKIPTYKIKKNKVTKILSYLKYIILFVLVFLIPFMYSFQNFPVPAFCKYICPSGTLEGAIGILLNPANADKFSMLGLLFTRKFIILSIILLSAAFIYRAFCRFLCPLGALYGLFAKFSIIGVRVNDSKCIDCGRCISKCPVDIMKVGDAECVHCGKCIDHCPTKAISFKAGKATLISHCSESNPLNKKNYKNIAIILALAILALALIITNISIDPKESNISNDNTVQLEIGTSVGMMAPDFTAKLYNEDGSFTLSDYLGKKVIINFWATWCTPCIAELPHFDEFQKNHPEVKIVALHSNLVTDDVMKYLSNYDYEITFGIDETGEVIKSFGGSTMLPHTIVINENGVITYNSVDSITYEKLESLI